MDIAHQFEFNGLLYAAQALNFLTLALPIFVTVYCLRYHRSRRNLPLWLILTWLVPLVGPLLTWLALSAADRSTSDTAESKAGGQ